MQHQADSYLSRITKHFNEVNLVAPKFTVYEETLYERCLRKQFLVNKSVTCKKTGLYAYDKSGPNVKQNKNSAITTFSKERELNMNVNEREEEEYENEQVDDYYCMPLFLENDEIVRTLSSLPTDQVLLTEETALPIFTKMFNVHECSFVNKRSSSTNDSNKDNNLSKTDDHGIVTTGNSTNDAKISEAVAKRAHIREFSELLCILQRPPSSFRWNTNFAHFLQTLWQRNFMTELLNLISTRLESRSALNDYEIFQENRSMQLYCEVLLFYVYHCNRCNALHKYIARHRCNNNSISDSNNSSNKENNLSIFEESSVIRVLHILQCVLFPHTEQFTTDKCKDSTKDEQIEAMLVCAVLEMMTTSLTMSFCNEVVKLLEDMNTSLLNTFENKFNLNSSMQSEDYDRLSTQNGNAAIFVLLSAFTQLAEVQRCNLIQQNDQRLLKEQHEHEEMILNSNSSSKNDGLVRESTIDDKSKKQEVKDLQEHEFNLPKEMEEQEQWLHRALTYICQSNQYDFDLSEAFRYDGPHSPALTLVSGKFSRTLERFLYLVNTSIWTYFTPLALQHVITCLPRYAYEWETKIPPSLEHLLEHLHNRLLVTATTSSCKVNEITNDRIGGNMHNNQNDNQKSVNQTFISLNKIDFANDAANANWESSCNNGSSNHVMSAVISQQDSTTFIAKTLILYYNALATLPYVKDEFTSWQHLLKCDPHTLHKLQWILHKINGIGKSNMCSSSELNEVTETCPNADNVNLLQFAIEIVEQISTSNNAPVFLSVFATNIFNTSSNMKIHENEEEEEEEEEEQHKKRIDIEKQKILLSHNLFESALTFLHALELCYRAQLYDIDVLLCSKVTFLQRVLIVCWQIVDSSTLLTHSIKVEKMALSLLERYAGVVEGMLMRQELVSTFSKSILPADLPCNYWKSASELHRLLLRLYMNTFLYRRMRSKQDKKESFTYELSKNSYCASKKQILNHLCRICYDGPNSENELNRTVANKLIIHRYGHWIVCVIFFLHYLEKMIERDNESNAHGSVNQKRFASYDQWTCLDESNSVNFTTSNYVSCLTQCVTTLHELGQAGEVYVCNMSIMHLLQVALQLLQSIFASSVNSTDLLSAELQSISTFLTEQLLLKRVNLVHHNTLDSNIIGNNSNMYSNEESSPYLVKFCHISSTSAFFFLLRMLFTTDYPESIISIIAELVLAALSGFKSMPNTAFQDNVGQGKDEQLYLSIRSMHTMKELQQFAIMLHNVVGAEGNTAINTLRLKVLYQLHESSPRTFLLFAGSESISENASVTSVNDLRLVKILTSRVRDNVELSLGNAMSTTANINSVTTFSSFNSSTICANSNAGSHPEESFNTRLPRRNRSNKYQLNSSYYEEKAIALDLLCVLGAFNSLTTMECETLLNAMSNYTVIETKDVSQDVNVNGEITSNNDIDDNDDEEENFGTQENNTSIINTSKTSIFCGITLCISSVIRYIASCIIHEMRSEQIENSGHESEHLTAAGLNPNKSRDSNPLTRDSGGETNVNVNTPLHLGRTRNTIISLYSDFIDHAIQTSLAQLNRLRTSYASIRSLLESTLNISYCDKNDILLTTTTIGEEKNNDNSDAITDFTSSRHIAFTGHDNVHAAYATPVNITPDISFQFTDNKYEASSRSSSTQNSSSTSEERCVWEKQQQQRGVSGRQWHDVRRHRYMEKSNIISEHDFRSVHMACANKNHNMEVVEKKNKEVVKRTVYGKGNTAIESEPAAHYLCPLLCGANYYFHGCSEATLLNVAASCLECMRVLCTRLTLLVQIKGDDNDINVLFVTRSMNLIRIALECAFLYRPSRLTGRSSIAPLQLSLLEHALTLAHTTVICSNSRYLLEDVEDADNMSVGNDKMLIHEGTLITSLRPTLHVLLSFISAHVMSYPAILSHGIPLLSLLKPNNVHDTTAVQKIFTIISSVLRNQNENEHDALQLLTSSRCNVVIESCELAFHRFGANCPTLTKLSIVQCVWQRIMSTMHCVNANDHTTAKPVCSFSKLLRLLMTVLTFTTSKSSSSSSELVYLLSAIRQEEFFAFLAAFEDCHTFTESKSWSITKKIGEEKRHRQQREEEEQHLFTYRPAWQYVWCMLIKLLTSIITSLHSEGNVTAEVGYTLEDTGMQKTHYTHNPNNFLAQTSGWLHRAEVFVSSSVRYKEAISALADYDTVMTIIQENHLLGTASRLNANYYLHFWEVEEVFLCTRLLALLQSYALHLTEFIPIVQGALAVYCRAQENVRATQTRIGAVNSSSAQSTPKPFLSLSSSQLLSSWPSPIMIPTLQASSASTYFRTEQNISTELTNVFERRLCKILLTHIARDEFTFLLNQVDHIICTQGELKRMEHSNRVIANNTLLLPRSAVNSNSSALTLDLLCNYTVHQLNRLRRSGIWEKTSKNREFTSPAKHDSAGNKTSIHSEELTSSRETSVTRTPSVGFSDTNSNVGGDLMDDAFDDINNSFTDCSFNSVKVCKQSPVFTQTNGIFTQQRQQLPQQQEQLLYEQQEMLDTLRAFREDIHSVYVDSAQLSLCLFTLAAEEMSKRLSTTAAAALTVTPQRRELTILCDKLLYTLNVLSHDLRKTSMTRLLNIVHVMQHRLTSTKLKLQRY